MNKMIENFPLWPDQHKGYKRNHSAYKFTIYFEK